MVFWVFVPLLPLAMLPLAILILSGRVRYQPRYRGVVPEPVPYRWDFFFRRGVCCYFFFRWGLPGPDPPSRRRPRDPCR